MHTTSYENVLFHYPGDFSGEVTIQVVREQRVDEYGREYEARTEELEVPYAALRHLVAQEVVANRIARLEQAEPEEILGLQPRKRKPRKMPTGTERISLIRRIERKIAWKIILDVIGNGYRLSVNNGGDKDEISLSSDRHAVFDAMFAADEDRLIVHKADGERIGMIRMIYGNSGWDVVNDYSVRLDELGLLDGAKALADKYQ